MLSNNSTIIVADDLTGANDTALQFFKNGLSTRIIIDYTQDFSKTDKVDVWAISTESRNVDRVLAHQTVSNIVTKLKNTLNIDNFYKKIDSTLRGRTGIEIATMLDVTKKDDAIGIGFAGVVAYIASLALLKSVLKLTGVWLYIPYVLLAIFLLWGIVYYFTKKEAI